MKSQVVLSTRGIFETIFCCSITIYPFSTDQHLLDNKCVSSTKDTGFYWYSKCGGGNSGQNIIFHLRDQKGRIFIPSLTLLEMNTDIFYANGSSTPFMPLSTLREKKSSQASKDSTSWLTVTVLLVCIFILLCVVLYLSLYYF